MLKIGFNASNYCICYYTHIINICSAHIIASVMSTTKCYLSNLGVPLDSNLATCNDSDDSSDDNDSDNGSDDNDPDDGP